MMSLEEDFSDLRRSLDLLNRSLEPDDVVRVYPLVALGGTLQEILGTRGYWRSLRVGDVQAMEAGLRTKHWNFSLEMTPMVAGGFGDLKRVALRVGTVAETTRLNITKASDVLPWPLLGGPRTRRVWALSLQAE
jgi:hypothetical protein